LVVRRVRSWMRVEKLTVVFEVTYRCPFSCPHCFQPKNLSREVSPNEFHFVLNLIKKVTDFKHATVILSGGEPCTARHLSTYIDIAKHLGYDVVLETRWLPPMTVLEHLKHVVVSIDSWNLELGKAIVNYVHKLGGRVAVRTTLVRNGLSTLSEILNFCMSKNIPLAVAPYIGTNTDLRPTKFEVQKALDMLSMYREVYYMSNCMVGKSIVVDPYLNARSCVFLFDDVISIVHYREKAIEKVLQSKKYRCIEYGLVP